jgi:tetratricopeptide (TPR) repeat protein
VIEELVEGLVARGESGSEAAVCYRRVEAVQRWPDAYAISSLYGRIMGIRKSSPNAVTSVQDAIKSGIMSPLGKNMKSGALQLLILVSTVATLSRGQDIDSIILRESTSVKRFTIIDQIADPTERRAFLKLYGAGDPPKRRKLAEEFVLAYPQSWLLAQAYEIAAKASIDLDDYTVALQFGSQSLRLFPENPMLLVPLANVQAQLQRFATAEGSAQAALEYLEQFDRPAAVSPAKWPSIQAELKASTYFVLGRVAAAAAMLATGSDRQQKLLQAESDLLQATALNTRNVETAYLLGLTELSLGRQRRAAFYFAEVRRVPGPLQAKALENLQRIYKSYAGPPAASFEAFLATIEGDSQWNAASAGSNSSMPRQAQAGDYAGSQACQPCHAAIYASWQKTGMSRMFRPYKPENVIGDFRENNHFSDETGVLVARMSIQHEKHYFAIRDSSGAWRTYPVDYTIGSKWQQAYATRLPTGNIHVFPVQYSAIKRQWINYWKVIDPPSSPRAEVTGFSHITPATNYQTNCAPCHTSQLRSIKAGSFTGHDLEFREGGINCEMCHGPAQNHVFAITSGERSGNTTLQTPVDFRQVSARDYVAICGQCHAQSALRQPGPQGEMNYSTQGPSFFRAYLSQPYADVARRAFYKDGRFRETTFIVEAFRRTACFRKGQAHCGHCHQPHAPDSSTNLTSPKFPNEPDRMCLQCHARFAANTSAHTHHPSSSDASRCVACHMPRIANSVLFRARTHQIDDIPDAEMTSRFGQEESPNACLLCHSEKDVRWVEAKLQAW